MVSRLDGVPVYEQWRASLAAADFNRVQLALKRLGEPLRITLANLRNLELVLDHDAWIVVDRGLNEIPVLAWTDFQMEGRAALHEPIPCVVKSYHAHSALIRERVLSLMRQALAQRLAERRVVGGERVIPLKKN